MAFEDIYGDMPLEERRVLRMDQLLSLDIRKEWIVKGLLHAGDCWMIKAKKKLGKSFFTQAFAQSCSYGGMFIDEYEISRPLKVAYICSEGSLVEWKDRSERMGAVHPFNDKNFYWINSGPVNVHNPASAERLFDLIKSAGVKFDLIIWDCFYKFIAGCSVNDDSAVGSFNSLEERMRHHFGAASIIVHHDSEKQFTDGGGNKHNSATTGNAMGSSFILANPTHFHTLSKHKEKNGRTYFQLQKGECRSGDIEDKITFFMVSGRDDDEDDSIGFVLNAGETNKGYQELKSHIRNNGEVPVRGLRESMNDVMPSATFDKHRKQLLKEGRIEKQRIGERNYYVWKEIV